MESFQEKLERLFDRGSDKLTELSEHWREHANRRTILTAIFAGVLTTVLYISVIEPPDNFPVGKLITIPEGASLSETATSFEEQGVIRSGVGLKILMAMTARDRDVHAGDYLFREPKSLFAIARAISLGAYGLEPIRIRVPEGATTRDMAKIFGAQLERFDEERFIELAQPMEGYLFPDTYFFLPNATDTLVLSTLRQNFDTQIVKIQKEIIASGKPLDEVVIFASLLEREATNMEDRRKIAGVLWNRLDRGMLLQVDAAFLYSLGRTTFDLTMADLTNEEDAYNTYVHKGLPPGPIGSPSLDSMLAVVTPIKNDYLYYLADDNYVTHYSKTYEEHLRKKRIYID